MSMSDAIHATELPGQSVYDQDMPEGYPSSGDGVRQESVDSGVVSVTVKEAFNALMGNLGNIFCVDRK